MVNTVTRADLADELYRNIGLSHNESSEIIEMFFEEILQCFEKGEEVKYGELTFKVMRADQRRSHLLRIIREKITKDAQKKVLIIFL